MQQQRHGAHLTQLTRFPRWFPVNVYLVQESDGLTLIDAAISGCEGDILGAAKALGAPIRRIILTHMHVDHIGSLGALHAALPEAELLYSERDARVQAGETRLAPGEPEIKKRAGYPKTIAAATRLLRDGDQVGSLRVISAPGHAPGQIALLDERDRSLIAGDAFQTRGGVAVSGTIVWSFPFPAFSTWDRPTALRTARMLRSLEPARLAVGHGNVIEAPGAAIDRAIAAAARSLGEGEAQAHGA
jgi:glyoxylase-like metal-dependent hydrolase (beta-lactamase superfamily II)